MNFESLFLVYLLLSWSDSSLVVDGKSGRTDDVLDSSHLVVVLIEFLFLFLCQLLFFLSIQVPSLQLLLFFLCSIISTEIVKVLLLVLLDHKSLLTSHNLCKILLVYVIFKIDNFAQVKILPSTCLQVFTNNEVAFLQSINIFENSLLDL